MPAGVIRGNATPFPLREIRLRPSCTERCIECAIAFDTDVAVRVRRILLGEKSCAHIVDAIRLRLSARRQRPQLSSPSRYCASVANLPSVGVFFCYILAALSRPSETAFGFSRRSPLPSPTRLKRILVHPAAFC